MDFIRSAYSVDFKFGAGSDTASRIKWFFPPPGTPFFPGDTPMRSLNWWDKEGTPAEVGEVWPGNRKYSKGQLVPGYTYGPPCGALSMFRNGVPSPPPPTPARNADGVPDCCLSPAAPCVPWSDGRRYASWSTFALVEPDPSFLGPQLGWYQPGTLDGFYWFRDLANTCSGPPLPGPVPGSQCWVFLNNTVGGQWPCTAVSYDAMTGGSTWRSPPESGYLPGTLLTIGGIIPCMPWVGAGTPLLTAGPFVAAAPDFGDWGPGGWLWLDPATFNRGFFLITDGVTTCGSSTAATLQTFDFDVSGTVYNSRIVLWTAGTSTATFTNDPASDYLPSVSVTVQIV